MFATLKAVPKKEGFLGLYKGNGAMMVRIFPYGAIQFMAFDSYKKVQYYRVTLGFSKTHDVCLLLLSHFTTVDHCGSFVHCFIILLKLSFVSFLLLLLLVIFTLQLLSKQIGISGHIHRLMAGSMAGKLSFSLISQYQLDIVYCTGIKKPCL